MPTWTARFRATVAGVTIDGTPGRDLRIERRWRRGDRIELDIDNVPLAKWTPFQVNPRARLQIRPSKHTFPATRGRPPPRFFDLVVEEPDLHGPHTVLFDEAAAPWMRLVIGFKRPFGPRDLGHVSWPLLEGLVSCKALVFSPLHHAEP